MRYKIWTVLLIILLIIGCGSEEEQGAKSIGQIHEEEGVPVRIKTIKDTTFAKKLEYTSTLLANRQSNASASMGGRIEKIHVDVGDYVQKDEVIMEFPKDAPSAKYKQAKTAYKLSKKTYERMKDLYESGGISKQKLDQARTKYEVKKADWETVREMVEVVAPISGMVTNINVTETQDVRRKTTLATVSGMDRLKTVVWVTEGEKSQIKKGMPATAIWRDEKIDGEVTRVAVSMDRKHSSFRVDIVFENPQHVVNPGVIADVQIGVYKNPNAYILPRKTVQEDRKGKYVYKIENNKAQKQYIETGREDGVIEITEGLESGDKVVVEGLNLVEDGSKVKILD